MSVKRNRILMIAPLPPPVHGSAMMSQLIKESSPINEAAQLDWVNLSTSRSIDEIGGRSLKKIWRFAASYLKATGKLLTHRYDTCYLAITCHGAGFIKDAPFVLLCKLFCKRIVIHQHNKGMAADVKRQPFKWLLPLVYRNTKVILLSERLYDDISAVVKREQILICPNGIPDCHPTPDKKNSSNGKLNILFLSNLIESKGVLILLDALKMLNDNGYSFSCRLIGGESDTIDTARINVEIGSRGLGGTVEYAGRKYNRDKEEEFERADIFVLPTYNDCFPLVILEAMAHNLPVVSTMEGAVPDMISDNVSGLLATRKSAEDFAEKLSKVMDMPEESRKRMGAAARDEFCRCFTTARFEENIKRCLIQRKRD